MAQRKIAITGGIGSGKSAVLCALRDAGYFTISCDRVNAELYKKHGVKRAIKSLFPSAVKGRIFLRVDKAEIARQVFSDREKLSALNALMHPLIIDSLLKKLNECKDRLAFAEVPLLFEGGYERLFDEVIVVCRDVKDRIESVKARSGLSDNEIKERMANQVDYDNIDLTKYVVIDNDGDLEKLKSTVLSVVGKI